MQEVAFVAALRVGYWLKLGTNGFIGYWVVYKCEWMCDGITLERSGDGRILWVLMIIAKKKNLDWKKTKLFRCPRIGSKRENCSVIRLQISPPPPQPVPPFFCTQSDAPSLRKDFVDTIFAVISCPELEAISHPTERKAKLCRWCEYIFRAGEGDWRSMPRNLFPRTQIRREQKTWPSSNLFSLYDSLFCGNVFENEKLVDKALFSALVWTAAWPASHTLCTSRFFVVHCICIKGTR